MPIEVEQLLEVVERATRERLDGRAERLLVVGRERAQRVLDAVAELAEHVAGTSFGVCVTKKTPTPLERISRTVWLDRLDERLARVRNSRCASSKKKTSLGLSRSPASGSVSNSSATSHISTVENSFGLSWTAAQLEARDDRRARRAPCAAGRRCRTAARRRTPVPPPVSSVTRSRSSTPTVAFESPPMPSSSALPSSESRKVSSARRSARSSSGRPLCRRSGRPAPRLDSCVSLAAEHLAEQLRPEVARPSRASARPGRSRRSTGTRPGSRSARRDPELGVALSAPGRRRRRRVAQARRRRP